MHKIFLGLGSNVGDRAENLRKALQEIKEVCIQIDKTSSFYETEPIGVTEQQWFYNMVIEGRIDLSPEQLFVKTKAIEKKLGRKKIFKWGPRIIDIDLLFYDDLEVDKMTEKGHLRLPHEQLKNRAFVIKPLLEIWPEATLPNGQKVSSFLDKVKNQHVNKLKAEN